MLAEGYAPGTIFGPQIIPICGNEVDRTCYSPGSTVPFDANRDGAPDTETEFRDFLTSDSSISLTDDRITPLLDDEDGDEDLYDHAHGKPVPDWQGSFGAELTLWTNLTINTLFEYRTGDYWVQNGTDAGRRSAPLMRNLREVAEVEAILLDPTTQQDADARFDAATRWGTEMISYGPHSGLHAVERADFVRWRELSLTYTTPQEVARRFRMDNLAITLSARNLALFTRYSGTDPEANWIGRCGIAGQADSRCNFVEGADIFVLPIPRSFLVSIRFGF
jgi:hypothetical protein